MTILADDQIEEEGSTQALLTSFRQQIPVVLIIDDRYRPFPYSLGEYTYAVLGYYLIVAAWGTLKNCRRFLSVLIPVQRNENLRITIEDFAQNSNLPSNGVKAKVNLGGSL